MESVSGKKNKSALQKVLKSGVITWLLLLAIWQIASNFNSPDFLPSPCYEVTFVKSKFKKLFFLTLATFILPDSIGKEL